jgi:hypothetical protein
MSVLVRSYKIIGTQIRVYEAWEPYEGHHTLTHIDSPTKFGEAWGLIGTAPLPSELAALPAYSDERYDAVKAFYASEYERAYQEIEKEHPELVNPQSCRDRGRIEVIERD